MHKRAVTGKSEAASFSEVIKPNFMLTLVQKEQFLQNGFLFLEEHFHSSEIAIINEECRKVVREDSPKKILEKNGNMRSFFAPHENSSIFNIVNRLERLVRPAEELLRSKVYIHQAKINSKNALVGDWWEWHQDYPYWYLEDGMPSHSVLTIMIFLDPVDEFNGPLLLIPGSQNAGLVDFVANKNVQDENNEWFNKYQSSKSYMPNLTADLKYTLKERTLSSWMEQNGLYAAKGKAGSALVFDGLVFHASSNNLSAWSRNTYLITYNSVANTLRPIQNPRPSFLANRDFTALDAIPDDSLMKAYSEF